MLMYSTGVKSGRRRRSILTYSRDGSDYIVAGTNGGNREKHPNWLPNIHADPNVTLEVANREIEATAREETGPERDRLWDQHVEQLPWFGKYPAQITGRVIPVVRLTPKG
jgi:deazaflavin-dependent oxidoreductase (nitroreductase family)